jgi:hypothetical protein
MLTNSSAGPRYAAVSQDIFMFVAATGAPSWYTGNGVGTVVDMGVGRGRGVGRGVGVGVGVTLAIGACTTEGEIVGDTEGDDEMQPATAITAINDSATNAYLASI